MVYGLAIFGAVSIGCTHYVMNHKPVRVKHPCRRCFFRADGKPKMAMSTPQHANLQSLIVRLRYNEKCRPYSAGGKYYIGHYRNAV